MASSAGLKRLSVRLAKQLRSVRHIAAANPSEVTAIAEGRAESSVHESSESYILAGSTRAWTDKAARISSGAQAARGIDSRVPMILQRRSISGGRVCREEQLLETGQVSESSESVDEPTALHVSSIDSTNEAGESLNDEGNETETPAAASTGQLSDSAEDSVQQSVVQAAQAPAGKTKTERKQEAAREAAAGKSVKELNQMLSELVSRGQHLEAKFLFQAWTAIPDNEPSILSYNFLLHAMVRHGDRHEDLMATLTELENRGLEPNMLTYNSVIRAAFRDRESYNAESILKRMESGGPKAAPDADSYNLVISVCAMSRRIGAALDHMQNMLRRGFFPSKSTYNEVLAACCRQRRTRDAIAIIKELKSAGIPPIPGTLGELLTASIEAEDAECCLLVLQTLAERRLPVDHGTLLGALNLAARGGNALLGEQAWALVRYYLRSKPAIGPFHLARIHFYTASADFVSAFRAVREMEEDLVKSSEEGNGMESDLFSPFTSLRPLVFAISRGVGVLDGAYYKLADMHAEREVVSLSAINCVIAGCSALRDIERAQQTFDEVEKTFELTPNVHTYNALMDGYGKRKQAAKAEGLFNDMKTKGLVPNAASYDKLANAFIMNHEASKAHSTVIAMIEAGFTPARELLMYLFRRSKRSDYPSGVDFAVRTIREIGYREANAGEVRRRNMLMEVSGVTQDSRPARRERGPPPSAGNEPSMQPDMQGRWQDSPEHEHRNWQ